MFRLTIASLFEYLTILVHFVLEIEDILIKNDGDFPVHLHNIPNL